MQWLSSLYESNSRAMSSSRGASDFSQSVCWRFQESVHRNRSLLFLYHYWILFHWMSRRSPFHGQCYSASFPSRTSCKRPGPGLGALCTKPELEGRIFSMTSCEWFLSFYQVWQCKHSWAQLWTFTAKQVLLFLISIVVLCEWPSFYVEESSRWDWCCSFSKIPNVHHCCEKCKNCQEEKRKLVFLGMR